MKKVLLFTLAGMLLLSMSLFGGLVSTVQAKDSNALRFDSMVGVPRPYTGNTNAIRGISGGGFPWVIESGSGKLSASGSIKVEVEGLVIDPNDPAAITAGVAGRNPVAAFKAVVSCLSKDAGGNAITVNVSTPTFPASAQGNAEIESMVTLPSPCIAPIIFVASPGGAWFATTGF